MHFLLFRDGSPYKVPLGFVNGLENFARNGDVLHNMRGDNVEV